MKIKITAFLAALLIALSASAYDIGAINDDGVTIYYNLLDRDAMTVEVARNINYSGSVNIPATFTYGSYTFTVTSIGDYAFSNCSGLTEVTIPNSVTSIGDYAFSYCSGLKKVNISDLVAWCNITFSNSYSNPLSFAHHLYLNDEEITDLIIPDSVTSIGNYAFSDCTGLTSVTISNSVTSIGDRAFYACSGLTEVTIPNSVTSIGFAAFGGCSGLTEVTIPNSVTSIGDSAFSYCTGLTEVTIPNSVTSIGYGAFYNCI